MARSGGSRPKKPCHCCKRYLGHLDEKNQNMNYFLRRMTANSKHSMVVPKRFLKHFDGKSGTIKLESPNRGRYDVRVTKRFNKVVFCHGWGKFVDSHHIEENDYLVFRHIDKSWFEVLILDSDGCEKVFPCAGIRNTPRFQGRSAEYVDTSSNSHHETPKSSASETAKMGATSSSSESGEDIPPKKTSLESDDLHTPHRQGYVLSKRSYLSEAQEKRVIALIQEIQPESIAFVAVMRKSHVETPCPYLAISEGYALAYFPHESTHITLQRSGKSKKWHPKFYKGNDKRPYMLRGQWLDFVLDNHVKEGDICLLFPTKAGRRSAFTVYLVRTTTTHSWGATGFERVGPCHGRSTTKMPCAVHIEEEPTDVAMAGSGASWIQKPCDACKRYLDHLDGKNQNVRCFLSTMTASSKHSMVVPKRFLKHFAGQLSGTIKLESPNHGSYDVEVTEHCNKVVFRHGWGEFVESHHIKENDSLLFRHVERSCFEVLIFDSDGCEKVFSCAGIRGVDYVDISSSSHHGTTESSASERFVRCQKGASCHHGKIAKTAAAFSSSEESGEDIPSENISSESDDLQTPMRQHYVLSRGTYLSEAQEERVIALIQEIQPESTAFVAIMRKSHVEPPDPSLAISKEYALAHFPHESTNVTLQRPGKRKTWHPILHKRRDGRMYNLRGHQWMDFVRDNGVQEGDICLFLLTTAARRSTFTVYLIQATATCSRVGSGKRGSLSRQKKTAKKSATSSLNLAGEDSLSGNESIRSDHIRAFSERNYVLSGQCHLTTEQEEKIVALVKKVQPEIPFLVFQMKKSNVNRVGSNLAICKGYATQHFPQENQYITLERSGGKKWHPWLHVRPDGRGYILTTQWQNFVRDNRLREDDICLFQPMPSEKGFRVMVHLLQSSGGRAHRLINSRIKRGVTSTTCVHEQSDSENSGSLDLHKRRTVQQGHHHVLSDCGGPSKPLLYVVLGGTCLTQAQDKVVQEKAMAIKAEVSIFVATMNKKILGYNNKAFILDFSDAADYLPDGKQALMLRLQGQGKAWRTNLHNRLMLATGEWREFARNSDLENGDICLFEPMKNERLAMLVHIIRSKQYS